MNALLLPLATDIDWVALIVLIVLFAVVTVLGFMATPLQEGRHARLARRVGAGRSQVRHLGDLVPARR